MNLPEFGQFSILAEGSLIDLVWVIGVVAFYIVGAIIKSVGNRGQSDKDSAETKKALQRIREQAQQQKAEQAQQANQRRAARTLPYARAIHDSDKMSDWDRQQELKRQELARARQEELSQLAQKGRVISSERNIPEEVIRPAQLVHQEPPPIPVAKSVPDAAEIKRQEYYAKAQRIQQARRNAQRAKQKTMRSVHKESTKRHETQPADQASPEPVSNIIYDLLKSPNQLRSGIILKEILDKPIALRDI